MCFHRRRAPQRSSFHLWSTLRIRRDIVNCIGLEFLQSDTQQLHVAVTIHYDIRGRDGAMHDRRLRALQDFQRACHTGADGAGGSDWKRSETADKLLGSWTVQLLYRNVDTKALSVRVDA